MTDERMAVPAGEDEKKPAVSPANPKDLIALAESIAWALRILGKLTVAAGILLVIAGVCFGVAFATQSHGASFTPVIGAAFGACILFLQGALLVWLSRYVVSFTAVFVQMADKMHAREG